MNPHNHGIVLFSSLSRGQVHVNVRNQGKLPKVSGRTLLENHPAFASFGRVLARIRS
jgi:hypothetical protein